jgi:hypothetical protein
MTVQRIEEHPFACSLRMSRAIHSSAPLGQTHRNPVRGAITAAVIASFLHQRFQQNRVHVIDGEPIARQLLRGQRENAALQPM